jgi:hypothetical protein
MVRRDWIDDVETRVFFIQTEGFIRLLNGRKPGRSDH